MILKFEKLGLMWAMASSCRLKKLCEKCELHTLTFEICQNLLNNSQILDVKIFWTNGKITNSANKPGTKITNTHNKQGQNHMGIFVQLYKS